MEDVKAAQANTGAGLAGAGLAGAGLAGAVGGAFRAVLFDNDGTLVDTHDLILDSMRHTMRTVLGREFPEEALMVGVGTPLATQMWDFTDDPAEQQELLRVYRKYNHAHHDAQVHAFPGMVDFLARLHAQGVKLGVVTAKLHALAWRGLEITGLAPYLDACIGADDCDTEKPEPGPVLAGCAALGVEPGECLYVGDSPYDIRSGNAAGCTTAAVLWGMFQPDALAAEHPSFTARTLADLESFLGL